MDFILQVRLCREKKSGSIYAMKKLKKSEMLSRGQVRSDSIKSYVNLYLELFFNVGVVLCNASLLLEIYETCVFLEPYCLLSSCC